MALLLPEEQIDHPAAAHMLARLAAVGEDGVVVATGILQRIGEDGEVVEARLVVDCLGQLDDGCALPLPPGLLDPSRAEWVTEQVPKENDPERMLHLLGGPTRIPEGADSGEPGFRDRRL